MAIVIPEIFSDAVNAHISSKVRLGKLATDYTDMVADIRSCGDTVSFPTINEITDASSVTKGTAIVPDALDMTDSTASIIQVAKGARIYDKDSLQVKGNVKDELAKQLAIKMSKKVETSLASEVVTNAVYEDECTKAQFTEDFLNEAFDVFGDEQDFDDFAGIVCHSSLRAKFYKMEGFVNASKTTSTDGNGIVRDDGLIGFFNNIPVYISDTGMKSNDDRYVIILKKNALGIVWQKIATIEEERQASLFCTDIFANELFAVKLIHSNGVELITVDCSTSGNGNGGGGAV